MFNSTKPPPLSPDLPELRAIAQLAGVAPSKLAAAFSDPLHLYAHITLAEVERLQPACQRLADFELDLVGRLDIAQAAIARGMANGR